MLSSGRRAPLGRGGKPSTDRATITAPRWEAEGLRDAHAARGYSEETGSPPHPDRKRKRAARPGPRDPSGRGRRPSTEPRPPGRARRWAGLPATSHPSMAAPVGPARFWRPGKALGAPGGDGGRASASARDTRPAPRPGLGGLPLTRRRAPGLRGRPLGRRLPRSDLGPRPPAPPSALLAWERGRPPTAAPLRRSRAARGTASPEPAFVRPASAPRDGASGPELARHVRPTDVDGARAPEETLARLHLT